MPRMLQGLDRHLEKMEKIEEAIKSIKNVDLEAETEKEIDAQILMTAEVERNTADPGPGQDQEIGVAKRSTGGEIVPEIQMNQMKGEEQQSITIGMCIKSCLMFKDFIYF